MAYMHVNYAVTQHGTGYPANTLASEYGEHLANIKLATDTDNGMIVGLDLTKAWPEYDVFDEAEPTTLTGIVQQKMPDGMWLVCVTSAENAYFVYQKPLTPYESPRELTKESAFYNKAGDIVRGYKLAVLDRIAVSEDNFNGTPVAGATISGVEDKKMTIGSY